MKLYRVTTKQTSYRMLASSITQAAMLCLAWNIVKIERVL
jgi:hypothetical protein